MKAKIAQQYSSSFDAVPDCAKVNAFYNLRGPIWTIYKAKTDVCVCAILNVRMNLLKINMEGRQARIVAIPIIGLWLNRRRRIFFQEVLNLLLALNLLNQLRQFSL
jgi:hypothetical protein